MSRLMPGRPPATCRPGLSRVAQHGIAESATLQNVVLKRDAGVLTLKSGAIGFASPQNGRDTLAVFSGEGEFSFDPPLGVEKSNLKRITGQDTVTEAFDRAIFCFTDETGHEFRSLTKPGSADPKLAGQLRGFRKRLRNSTYHTDNLDAILLADLYNPAQRGFFSAYLHGRKHGDLQFQVKPRGLFPISLRKRSRSSISIPAANRAASGSSPIR